MLINLIYHALKETRTKVLNCVVMMPLSLYLQFTMSTKFSILRANAISKDLPLRYEYHYVVRISKIQNLYRWITHIQFAVISRYAGASTKIPACAVSS